MVAGEGPISDGVPEPIYDNEDTRPYRRTK